MYLGRHVNIRYGFLSSADYAKKVGSNFFQIFLVSPHSYNSKRQSRETLLALRQKLIKNNQKVVIHASFMLNFCNPPESYIHRSALNLLIKDMEESAIIGAIGVVVHMGKNCAKLKMSEEEALNNYVSGIKHVLSKTPADSTIIFETAAGQGTEICTSIFDLRRLYDCFNVEERARIKFCIDTCHVFSAGYDLSNTKYVDLFCDLIGDLLGWRNVACIHLNDSRHELDCKKDRHADLGNGYIGMDGLRHFATRCVQMGVPIVTETPCEVTTSKDEVVLMKSWFE